MRHVTCLTAAGLLTGLLLSHCPAADVSKPAAGTKPEVCTTGNCGTFGTSVQFVKTPSEAARQALKEQKLVLVLHVSGDFEDPAFT